LRNGRRGEEVGREVGGSVVVAVEVSWMPGGLVMWDESDERWKREMSCDE
jgi:hypothetical protein